MYINEKNVFWHALVITLFIFGIGILIGIALENYRSSQIDVLYANSELETLDVRTQSDLFEVTECNTSINENINFANRIFEEAKILNKYETASRITESISLRHKKYDLLRTILWLNSIKIKEKCNATYHNIIYFYQYNEVGIEKKSRQNVISKFLQELKEKYGDEIILIPIASDNNLSSINLLLTTYNITSLPTILVDEKYSFQKFSDIFEIEQYLN